MVCIIKYYTAVKMNNLLLYTIDEWLKNITEWEKQISEEEGNEIEFVNRIPIF